MEDKGPNAEMVRQSMAAYQCGDFLTTPEYLAEIRGRIEAAAIAGNDETKST